MMGSIPCRSTGWLLRSEVRVRVLYRLPQVNMFNVCMYCMYVMFLCTVCIFVVCLLQGTREPSLDRGSWCHHRAIVRERV